MKSYPYLLLLFVTIPACMSKVPYSKSLEKELRSKEIDLEQIQFYTDQKIILTRELSSEKARLQEGKVKHRNGKNIQRIKLKKNTPGVLKKADPSSIEIAFEKGRTLRFGASIKEENDFEKSYQLLIDSLLYGDKGLIWYGGKRYTIENGIHTQIKIKSNRRFSRKVNRKKVKGLRISGQ